MTSSDRFNLRAAPWLALAIASLAVSTGGAVAQDGTMSRAPRIVVPAPPPPATPLPVAFPPNPPPLGALIVDPPRAPAADSEWWALAPHVGEIFYPALSTHVFTSRRTGALPDAHQKRLTAFRTLRDALLADLAAHLPSLALQPPAERRQAWQELARTFAPRLARLEQEAEAIRRKLAAEASWNELRDWRLGRGHLNRPREELRAVEFMVVRAAVFYQAGLSLEQRWLLRERAMQLEEVAFGHPPAPPPAGAFVWFAPATTQIFLPPETPPTLATQFLGYASRKSALQDELQDAIYAHERDRFEFTRTGVLKKLAEAQAPRLAALERDAEQLREALAAWGDFPRRAPVRPWPAALRDLVAEYDELAAAFDTKYREALAHAREKFPSSPRGDPVAHERWKRERVQLEARARAALDQEFAAERAALHALLDQIRVVVRETFGAHAVQEQAQPDGFLRVLQRAFRRAEAYHFYDLAVLEPGLSPELRRLLFSRALELLGLPLPGAERQASHLAEIPGS